MAQTKTRKPLLTIAEALEGQNTVDIFGERYNIKSSGQIGQATEEELLAKFQMLTFFSGKLDQSKNEDEARKWAAKLRDAQVGICSVLTDIPENVAARIPMSGRVQLMDILADEAGFNTNKDDDEDDDGTGDDSGN